MASKVYDSLRRNADKLKTSIIKGDKFTFGQHISFVKHNLQIWEKLGDERTQSQMNDQQLKLVIDIYEKRDEIYSLLPIYEKAPFFEKETNFFNQSWKDKFEKHQTNIVRPNDAFQMRTQLINALRYGDSRFNELTFLDENRRKKLSETFDYLDSIKDKIDEFVKFCYSKEAVQTITNILKSPTEKLKQIISKDNKSGVVQAYYDLRKARDAAMYVPFFDEAKEMDPLKPIYDDMTQMINDLENGQLTQYWIDIEKEPILKKLNEINAKSTLSLSDCESTSTFISKIFLNFVLEDSEVKSAIDTFYQKAEEVLRQEKEKAYNDDINTCTNQMKTAMNNSDPKNAISQYTKLLLNPNRGFVFDITTCEPIQKLISEDFPNKYQIGMTPNFTEKADVEHIFNNRFMCEFNNIKDALENGNMIKFMKSTDNLKTVRENTEYLDNISDQQRENKDYKFLIEILDNLDQVKAQVPLYPKFRQFMRSFNDYASQYMEPLLTKKFSTSQIDNFHSFLRVAGPLYYEEFHELQFLISDEEKDQLERLAPIIKEYYPKRDQIAHELYLQYYSEELYKKYGKDFIDLCGLMNTETGQNIQQAFDSYAKGHYELAHIPLFSECAQYYPLSNMAAKLKSLIPLINEEHHVDVLYRNFIVSDKISRVIDAVNKNREFREDMGSNFENQILDIKYLGGSDAMMTKEMKKWIEGFFARRQELFNQSFTEEFLKKREQAIKNFKNLFSSKRNILSNKQRIINDFKEYSFIDVLGFIVDFTMIPEIQHFAEQFKEITEEELIHLNGETQFEMWTPSDTNEFAESIKSRQFILEPIQEFPEETTIRFEIPDPPVFYKFDIPPSDNDVEVKIVYVETKQKIASEGSSQAAIQQPTTSSAAPAPVQKSGNSKLNAVFNAVKRSVNPLMMAIQTGNEKMFDTQIEAIDKQLSNINIFESDELSEAQSNDENYQKIYLLYQEKDTLRCQLETYKKADQFFKQSSFINDRLIQQINEMNEKPIPLATLQNINKQMKSLNEINDNTFIQLTYIDPKKMDQITKAQDFLTTNLQIIEDKLEEQTKLEEGKALCKKYQPFLKNLETEIKNKSSEPLLQKHKAYKDAIAELYEAPTFSHCQETQEMTDFLKAIEEMNKRLEEEKLIESAEIRVKASKFVQSLEDDLDRTSRQTKGIEECNTRILDGIKRIESESPEVKECEVYQKFVERFNQIYEKQETYREKDILDEQRFVAAKLWSPYLPLTDFQEKLNVYQGIIDGQRHFDHNGKQYDLTKQPNVAEDIQKYHIFLKQRVLEESIHKVKETFSGLENAYKAQNELFNKQKSKGFAANMEAKYMKFVQIAHVVYATGTYTDGRILTKAHDDLKNFLNSNVISALKANFDNSFKQIQSDDTKLFECRIIASVVNQVNKEEGEKLQQRIQGMEPKSLEYKVYKAQKFTANPKYLEDIKKSLETAKEYINDAKEIEEKTDVNQKIEVTENELPYIPDELVEYDSLLIKAMSVLYGVKNSLITKLYDKETDEEAESLISSLKEKVLVSAERTALYTQTRLRILVDAIKNPPPKVSTFDDGWFEHVGKQPLLNLAFSNAIADFAPFEIIANSIGKEFKPYHDTIEEAQQNIKEKGLNNSQKTILEEAEYYSEDTILQSKIIVGLFRNFSTIPEARERCMKIYKVLFEKNCRFPLSTLFLPCYVLSDNDRCKNHYWPIYKCDYKRMTGSGRDLYRDTFYEESIRHLISVLTNICTHDEDMFDAGKALYESDYMALHPAYCNPLLSVPIMPRGYSPQQVLYVNCMESRYRKLFNERALNQLKMMCNDHFYTMSKKWEDHFNRYRIFQFSDFTFIPGVKKEPFMANLVPIAIKNFPAIIEKYPELQAKLPKKINCLDTCLENTFFNYTFDQQSVVAVPSLANNCVSFPSSYQKILCFVHAFESGLVGSADKHLPDTIKNFVNDAFQRIINFAKKDLSQMYDMAINFHEKYTMPTFILAPHDFDNASSHLEPKVNSFASKGKAMIQHNYEAAIEEARRITRRIVEFLDKKYISGIKDGTVIKLHDNECVASHPNKYVVQFSGKDFTVTARIMDEDYDAQSIMITYNPGVFDCRTIFTPTKYINKGVDAEAASFLHHKDQLDSIHYCDRSEFFTYSYTEKDANTAQCSFKKGTIEEEFFIVIANYVNHADEYVQMNQQALDEQREQDRIRREEERERERIRREEERERERREFIRRELRDLR